MAGSSSAATASPRIGAMRSGKNSAVMPSTMRMKVIAAGISLREIAEDRFGLEDIFLAATRRAPGEARRP